MSHQFSWIHLSDLHSRTSTLWESDRVTTGLLADLEQKRDADEFRPDALFFTGDAAFGSVAGENIADQYTRFGELLDKIRNTFSPAIAKERVFIVPGNHDTDRDQVLETDTEWLRRPERTEEEIIRHLSKPTKECIHWMKRLASYQTFIREYGLHHLSPDESRLIWSHKFDCCDHTVGIAGLNSAWSCATNKEKAKLWMGGKWQIGEMVRQLGKVDFSIALVHHPANWLVEEEDPQVGRLLLRDFDLVLHGHEHADFVRQESDGTIQISAGASYDRLGRPKEYSFGSINLKGTGGGLWPRVWDEVGGGWVSKNIAGKAPDGKFSFDPWRRTQTGNRTIGESGFSTANKQNQILSIEGPPTSHALDDKFRHLRRRPYGFERHHSRIRLALRAEFEDVLSRERLAWLVADWQMGKEGFISGALNNLGSTEALEAVYRIDCGKSETVEQILDEGGTQLGIAFVEFAELINRSGQATLVLEDVQIALVRAQTLKAELFSKLQAILSFSPKLRIVVVLRQWAEGLQGESVFRLQSLEISEIENYLKAHPDGRDLAKRVERLEDIYAHTGGLPTALDRLIVKSKYVDLEDILDDHSAIEESPNAEPAPQTLVDAVSKVFHPQNGLEQRTLALLKLLTVLKDGETLESVRRIYPRKPFREDDVIALADLALIETLPIEQRTGNFVTNKRAALSLGSSPKLIRVPRQVRDYVLTLISSEERTRIFNTVSHSIFGERWYEGKIKLRRAIVVAYKQSTIAGPANELLAAQFLLRSALDKNNPTRIERFASLAVDYCQKLIAEDRFRDAAIACRALLKMLDENANRSHWSLCAYYYGRALRMTGQLDAAIDVLERIVGVGKIESKGFRADIYLNLAWANSSLERKGKAKEYALEAIEISEKEDDDWLQATALVAQIELDGGQLDAVLRNLLGVARRNRKITAANNIALDLARRGKSMEESLRLLDEVIASAKDLYNQTRAVVDKAKLLRKSGRIGDLKPEEEIGLCAAYEYSCSQRLSGLLDSCHDALWDYCLVKGFWSGLFRIFRFSSFVWRLTDRSDRESNYISKLVETRDANMESIGNLVEVEIEYLGQRIEQQANGTDRHLNTPAVTKQMT
ncbi:MAG: metallophosphoesterase [Akkermansiaceae bacterium]|nr:metallophosphoesterase [Akkermansiaceae bacterium]MCF7733557.1 metallophosphoesterase [Akkermansiaceae bacterium]